MTMKYRNQAVLYDNTEGTSTGHDAATLENTPSTHSILEKDGETNTKYSEDPKSQRDQADLQEHFQQLQEWLTQLELTTNPSIHV